MSAKYQLVEYQYNASGASRVMAKTSTSWTRELGNCNTQTFHRSGDIYTQARFKAWLKKYQPYMTVDQREEEVEKLPKKVWFL